MLEDVLKVEGGGEGIADVGDDGEFDFLAVYLAQEVGTVEEDGDVASQGFGRFLVDRTIWWWVYQAQDAGRG
ncbi:MAG: hypothetical protein D6706_05905 [Chloroflexi bacterium]|nr:MAG: hypothetical protein D6706_05905 [Chloroflexota bacterium]